MSVSLLLQQVAHGGTGHQGLTFWEQEPGMAEGSGRHGEQLSPDPGDSRSGVGLREVDTDYDEAADRYAVITVAA